MLKTKKEAEKQVAKLDSSTVVSDPSAKEASLQKERDKLMVSIPAVAVITAGSDDRGRTERPQMLNVSAQLPQYDPHEVHAQ